MSKTPKKVTTDPRTFLCGIFCRHCSVRFETLQDARQHFMFLCPRAATPSIRCGCCDQRFTNWSMCCAHLNMRGAHLRPPTNYVTISSSSTDEEPGPKLEEAATRSNLRSAAMPPRVSLPPSAASRVVVTAEVHAPPASAAPVAAAAAAVAVAASTATAEPDTVSSTSNSNISELSDVQPIALSKSDLNIAVEVLNDLTAAHGQPPSVASGLNTPPVAAVSPSTITVGANSNEAQIWRQRYYTLSRHLLYWVQESSNSLSESEQVAARLGLIPDVPPDTDMSVPVQDLARDLLPYYQLQADEQREPDL